MTSTVPTDDATTAQPRTDRRQRQATEGKRIGWVERRMEPGPPRRAASHLVWSVAAAALVLAVWWTCALLHVWTPLLLPPPPKVWHAFIQSVTTHDGVHGLGGYYLWQHLWASLWRIVKGVMRAIVIGVPLGLAISMARPVQRLGEPIVDFLRALPPLGYFSLLILWFGIGDSAKVWLLTIATFPPITIATIAGVAALKTERINAALVLGASRRQLLLRTVMPSILPDVLTGIRIATGFAWTTIVAAETTAGLPGVGGLAWSTKKELRPDIAILCVIVIGLTAVVLDGVLRAIERRLVPWKGRA